MGSVALAALIFGGTDPSWQGFPNTMKMASMESPGVETQVATRQFTQRCVIFSCCRLLFAASLFRWSLPFK